MRVEQRVRRELLAFFFCFFFLMPVEKGIVWSSVIFPVKFHFFNLFVVHLTWNGVAICSTMIYILDLSLCHILSFVHNLVFLCMVV